MPSGWLQRFPTISLGSRVPGESIDWTEPPENSPYVGKFYIYEYTAARLPFKMWRQSKGSTYGNLNIVEISEDFDFQCGRQMAHRLNFVTLTGGNRLTYEEVGIARSDGGTIVASYEHPDSATIDPDAETALHSPCAVK
jgi:hypothetical protein